MLSTLFHIPKQDLYGNLRHVIRILMANRIAEQRIHYDLFQLSDTVAINLYEIIGLFFTRSVELNGIPNRIWKWLFLLVAVDRVV